MDEQVPAVPVDEAKPVDSSRRNAITIFGIVMLLIFAGAFIIMAPKGKPAGGILPNDPKGYAMPQYAAERIDGEGKLDLAKYIGKPLVVNFWGAWCSTCKLEGTVLGEAERKWRDQGVVFIGIDSKDTNEAALNFDKEYEIDYPSIVDPNGDVAAEWGVTGFPETFFIDKSGRIVSKFISALDTESLDASISQIVG